MAKRLKHTDLINDPVGIVVMGMTEDDVLFKGIVTKVICRYSSSPDTLRVEGTAYYGFGDMTSHFYANLPVKNLRIFNENEFNDLQDYIKKSASATETANHYKKKCRELLT